MCEISIRFDIGDSGDCVEFYTSGQTVKGSVVVNLDKSVKAKHVGLRVDGKAHTEWNDGEAVRRDDHYYIQQNLSLWKKKKGKNFTVLEKGEHQYPFTFVLPSDCPSTFVGKFGWIGYSCEAYVDCLDLSIPDCLTTMKVLDLLDISKNPEDLMHQERQAFAKVPNCDCCDDSMGLLNNWVSVSKGAFLPGETMFIDIDVENSGRKAISRVHLELIQVITFTVRDKKRQVTQIIGSLDKGSIPGGENRKWSKEPIFIPEETLPTINNCPIIKLFYQLSAKIPCDCVGMRFPIIIGNVCENENAGLEKENKYFFEENEEQRLVKAVEKKCSLV